MYIIWDCRHNYIMSYTVGSFLNVGFVFRNNFVSSSMAGTMPLGLSLRCPAASIVCWAHSRPQVSRTTKHIHRTRQALAINWSDSHFTDGNAETHRKGIICPIWRCVHISTSRLWNFTVGIWAQSRLSSADIKGQGVQRWAWVTAG